MTLFFNFKNQLLQDKAFREAVALSIPYDQLAEFGDPANSPIPPTSWAYNPNLKSTVEDLDTAKNSFQKYTENASSSASLNFQTFYDYLGTANLIDNNLKQAGLKTNLTLSTGQTIDFDLLLAFWQIPKDPDQYFFWHSTQTQSNILSYKNVKVDKLLEDGRSTLNVAERKNFYLQFQKAIADDVPAIFLYYPYAYTVQRK
jgi:peptide/nickel transport system substrate-binding protein